MSEQEKQILAELKAELFKDESIKESWKEVEKHVQPILEVWATSLILLATGNEDDKDAAKKSIRNSEDSIGLISRALASKLENYLVNKIVRALRSTILGGVMGLL